jgi:hypothetical protein
MEVVHSRCAGLDVHKKSVSACVLWYETARQTEANGTRFECSERLLAIYWHWRTGCGNRGLPR